MQIKSWAKFQHFKDRRPPWIKLYRDILDDIEWHELPAESAKTLVMLWLIASEEDGNLPDLKTLSFRLRIPQKQLETQLKDLGHWIETERYQSDISVSQKNSVAEVSDHQETERETEKETEGEPPASQSPPPHPVDSKPKATTLAAYLRTCKAKSMKPVPDGHFVRSWAQEAGITPDMLQIAWLQFRERYTEDEKAKRKRYTDWPAHFATAVKNNWFKLWFHGDDGMSWSSVGMTHKSVLDARLSKQEVEHAA
jgi:hypothetical protein